MLRAVGRSVRAHGDGTFTATVAVVDDAPTPASTSASPVLRTFQARTLDELKTAVAGDLQRLATAQTDAALSAAIVGIELAQQVTAADVEIEILKEAAVDVVK